MKKVNNIMMKLTTAQGEHSATGCLLDYECIKIIVDQ